MENTATTLPYSCLKLSPYPEQQEDHRHSDIPLVTNSNIEWQRAHRPLKLLHETSEARFQRAIESYARQIELTRAEAREFGDGDGGGDLPLEILERYGGLSYRMMRRIEDLRRAQTTIPTFHGDVPVRGENLFIITLVQVALRRLHIKTLNRQILSAADEWRSQLRRLTSCEHYLRQFQDLAVFDMEPRFPESQNEEWRSAALALYFIPRTELSERGDRLTVRMGDERELVRVMERALELLECDEKDRWREAEPDVESDSWESCLMTVTQFYDYQPGGDVGALMRLALAGAMWRFTYMLWKDWEYLSHSEIIELYCYEILNLRRAQLSSPDGLWPEEEEEPEEPEEEEEGG